MNSIIHISAEQKDIKSVPIVILKREYFVLPGEEKKEIFNWKGFLFPFERVLSLITNFLNSWGNSFTKETYQPETTVRKSILILNTETGMFEKLDEMPDKISLLIQENVNINER